MTQSTAGNRVVTNQSFDPDTGLMLGIRAGSSGAVASFDYNFDTFGNLNSRADNVKNFAEGFCYDNLNRLTNSAVGPIGTNTWGGVNWGGFVWGAACGTASTSNWGIVNWGSFNWGASCATLSCKSILYDSGSIGNIVSKSDVGTYSYPPQGQPSHMRCLLLLVL